MMIQPPHRNDDANSRPAGHAHASSASVINRVRKVGILIAVTSTLVATAVNPTQGQTLFDGGFESYPVGGGGYVKPDSGPWLFVNDAGVVEPFAPNSSTGALNTWSATFAAIEGQQYASTYAAGDSLRQSASFPAPGQYRLSVFAAAPGGSLTIPSVGTFTLGDGEFTFLLNNTPVGSLHTVSAGSTWNTFIADFSVATPGDYQVGLRNTRTAAYFVNYDAFTVTLVPEPTVLQSSLALGAAVFVMRAFTRANKGADEPRPHRRGAQRPD